MSGRKVSMKSTRTSTAELKEELLKWICERHATNGPLDRKLLRERAMELATSYGVIGFKCSEAWLTVFLKKHGFSPGLTNCSGPTFTDYRVWIDLLRSLITQYRHKDLFSVDELLMYSDFLPSSKTLREDGKNNEISSERKRIGILLCCNSSGTEKLEPVISNPLEKMENPLDEFSCTSDETFGAWLERLNADMSMKNRNILLLLSRERIRSLQYSQRLSHVKLVFFPNDFPAQLRPLRGDIFHCVKMTYRCRYVGHIRGSIEQWTTKEIVESVFEAWKDVPQELIVSSFQRTKFREDESFLKIECPDWDALETGMTFRKFVTFDDQLSDMSNRPNDRQIIFFSCNRYNLRKRDIVDIDEETNEKSTRTRNIVNGIEKKMVKNDGSIDDSPSLVEPRYTRISELSDELPDNHAIIDFPNNTGGRDICENREKRRIRPDFRYSANETSRTTSDKILYFPGEAGPSGGEEFNDTREIAKDSPGRDQVTPLEFNDAIETCDDIERNDENFIETIGSSKRYRSVIDDDDDDDDDDDEKKRSKLDWSKRYEKNFVFGPEADGNDKLLLTNRESPAVRSAITGSREKRSIFEGNNSSGLSKTKD